VGKSWLGDTVPAPRLVIDLEGRAKYTPSRPKVAWDPRVAPPVYDGTWQTCVVSVHEFEQLSLIYQWLRSGQHPFVSVTLDSLMEAQKRCMDVVVPGVTQPDQQNWGELLRRLEKLVRAYRDLTLIPSNPVRVVVLIVGSRHTDEGWQPMLQGQLRDSIPYYMDVVGYYFKQPQADGSFVRSLLIDQQPGFLAKDNTDRLVSHYGAVVPNPNIEQLLQLLYTNGKPEGLVGEGVAA
jgi:hypothetical protein